MKKINLPGLLNMYHSLSRSDGFDYPLNTPIDAKNKKGNQKSPQLKQITKQWIVSRIGYTEQNPLFFASFRVFSGCYPELFRLGWEMCALIISFLGLFCGIAQADPGRIYTHPDTAVAGGVSGSVNLELTHALAVDHERLHVFLADLTDGGRHFAFTHLPIGKFDLVLVSKNHAVYEGLSLGDTSPAISPVSTKNLATRIAVADSFFNRHTVCRIGFNGDRAYAFVERLRDKLTLQQSGEKLDHDLRRLEVIELEQAGDDWQMVNSRHLYREEEPPGPGLPFFQHFQVSGLGNIRVVDSVKDLGVILLSGTAIVGDRKD